jgi:hypothetical protein
MTILSKKDRDYLNSIVSNFNNDLKNYFGSSSSLSTLEPKKLSQFLDESKRQAEAAEIKKFIQSFITSYINNIRLILTKVDLSQDNIKIYTESFKSELANILEALSGFEKQLLVLNGSYQEIDSKYNSIQTYIKQDHNNTNVPIDHLHPDIISLIEEAESKVKYLKEEIATKLSEIPRHAIEHIQGGDAIPIVTKDRAGLASPAHLQKIDRAVQLADNATSSMRSFVLAGSGIKKLENDTEPTLSDYLKLNSKGLSERFIAGEDLNTGDICYYKSDGKMWKADASSSTTATNFLALILENISANATGTFLVFGRCVTSGLTIGSLYYLSETSGSITAIAPSTSGAIVRPLGTALSATTLWFNPSNSWVEIA